MLKVDSIIFDLDGTLWNATFSTSKYFETRLVELGYDIKLPQPLVQSVMGKRLQEIADVYFKDYPSDVRMDMMNKANEFKGQYLREHGGMLYPKLEETLSELSKQYRLFIVSNCTEEYLEAFFAAHPIQKYFVDFENSGRTGLDKDKNIQLVVERNQLKAPAYLGDIEADKVASYAANVPFIFAAYGFGDVAEYDAKIDKFEDLPTVVMPMES